MRRPSVNFGVCKGTRSPWKESQAIEQVIFLKPLPESITTESENHALFRQRIQVPHLENSAQFLVSENGYVGDMQISDSTNENDSWPRRGSSIGDVPRDAPDPAHDRNLNFTNGLDGQMTIFYCGNAYVYDSVAVDKAHAILRFAASDTTIYQDSPAIAPKQLLEYQLQVASIRSGLTFSSGVSPYMHNAVTETSQLYRDVLGRSREFDLDGAESRKASLQRYLEKRKDRGRFKIMRKAESSSNLEMYTNYQNPYEQPSQGMGYSPPQPRPPHTPTQCNSVENQAPNNATLSHIV